MLELLLDGINRQPTKARAKLSIVRFRSHDKLRSGLYFVMVADVTCTISMVDDKVNEAIMKFIITRTWLRVKCIKVMNLPFALVDKNTSTELPIFIIHWIG
jgi:hypothetical protein